MLKRFALRPMACRAMHSQFDRGFAAVVSKSRDSAAPERLFVDQHTNAASTTLVKRKVVIVGGYMGKDYHGLQLNDNVQTIESELRHAVFQAGAMRKSNFEDLSKIDWARSSRTDKGVHAGCIVFSGGVECVTA